MNESIHSDRMHEILRDVFGYRHFRGQQEAVIDAVLKGRDALVVMPTGGGKSLCYQIPALLREGAGLVGEVDGQVGRHPSGLARQLDCRASRADGL